MIRVEHRITLLNWVDTMSDKNITFNFTAEEQEKLQELVDFFQRESITTVTRSDVVKYLLSKFHKAVELGKFGEVVRLSEGGTTKEND